MNRSVFGVLLVGSMAIACGPPGALRQIPEKRLSVKRFSATDQTVHVFLSHGLEDPCPELGDDLRGTINGAPLTVTSRGGTEKVKWWTRCRSIELTGRVPGPGVVSVRVWDASEAIEAEYPELFSERRVEVIEPADQVLYIGDRALLRRWPPGEELVDLLEQEELRREIPVDSKSWRVDAVLAGDDALFEVPEAPFHVEGPSELVLFGAAIRTRASRCIGAASCFAFPGSSWPKTAPVVIHNRRRSDHRDCFECRCSCNNGSTIIMSRPSGDGRGNLPVNCSADSCSASCRFAVTAATCTSVIPVAGPPGG
jgi:hypothetical protein